MAKREWGESKGSIKTRKYQSSLRTQPKRARTRKAEAHDRKAKKNPFGL